MRFDVIGVLMIGALAERRLFFAEAKHVVTLCYRLTLDAC
jgi:DMSO reductase anchor subunit